MKRRERAAHKLSVRTGTGDAHSTAAPFRAACAGALFFGCEFASTRHFARGPPGARVARSDVMNTGRTAALILSLAATACGGAAPTEGDSTPAADGQLGGLGPFRLGMSAVELRLACADHGGRDWSPNQHAFTRGCEVSVDVQGITFQRFELRLDGAAGNLMRVRGHADNANERDVRRAFPGAEIVAVEDVVLVTVSAPQPSTDELAGLQP